MKLFLKREQKTEFQLRWAICPCSLAFGILAVNSGQPWWAPVVTSLSNFTGTGQFARHRSDCGQCVAHGNLFYAVGDQLRHLLMSLSLSQRVRPEMKLLPRMAIAFGITDEVFAVSLEQEAPLSGRYLAGSDSVVLCRMGSAERS